MINAFRESTKGHVNQEDGSAVDPLFEILAASRGLGDHETHTLRRLSP